ncbi:hypothetical protein [Paraburkholderia sp. EG304]|uniref:hypothetical protein n=1 Tax=Paraburkholderia sp. EG304 TaxID=3237015 RepID=UPI00397E3D15
MKRVPAGAIDFADHRGEIAGFARDWFFWVHQSFKPALDITYSEVIDPDKTKAIRDAEAQRRGYRSLEAMQASIKEAGETLGDSVENAAVMRYAVHKSFESQGMPPLYRFRATDGFESRCGRWYLQILQATEDRAGDDGPSTGGVGVQIYARSTDDGNLPWSAHQWHSMSQAQFVELLKSGQNDTLSLLPDAPDAATTPPLIQADLFAM